MRLFLRGLLAFFVSLCAFFPFRSDAHDVRIHSLLIDHPWVYGTSASVKKAAGYMTIRNSGSKKDRLISVISDSSSRVEIHQMTMKGDVMSMRLMKEGLEIPCKNDVLLQPGHDEGVSYHLMFLDLKKPFLEGESIPAKLVFEKAGEVAVEFKVENISYKPHHGHSHEHDHK